MLPQVKIEGTLLMFWSPEMSKTTFNVCLNPKQSLDEVVLFLLFVFFPPLSSHDNPMNITLPVPWWLHSPYCIYGWRAMFVTMAGVLATNVSAFVNLISHNIIEIIIKLR